MDIDNEKFVSLIRSALRVLYDPDQLRRSPLANLLDVSNRVDASFKLQKILIDAIESIQPNDNEPAQSRAWLLHDLLYFRYVRGYERQAVADQLGISDRQLSRDQRSALEALAQHIWTSYRLEESANQLTATTDVPDDTPIPALSTLEDQPGESSWVSALPADRPSPWKATLVSVLDLLRPLIQTHEVKIACLPDDTLPDLLAPQNTLRHSLLNILSLMIPLAQRTQLQITPSLAGQALRIAICIDDEMESAPSLATQPSIGVARQLVESSGGTLRLTEEGHRLEVIFTIPVSAQIPILVIDDNAELIQLFQRYVQGTRYSVVGTSEAQEFFKQLDLIHPRIILMDVMMPGLDGWDLLTRLRQDRQYQNTAILICSILPQATLALSLGADGFLQKPVLPQDFLQALDDQLNRDGVEPKTESPR